MLFKRGSTISAAEGGCQAEVGGNPSFLCVIRRLCDSNWLTQLRVRWQALGLRLVWAVSHVPLQSRFGGISCSVAV